MSSSPTKKKVFLDSSILIEYRKGVKTSLLDVLLDWDGCELYIGQVVASEYLYHSLAIFGGKSPLAIKEASAIGDILQKGKPLPFLDKMNWLSDDVHVLTQAVALMSKYNLLPNDALILGLCQLHGIATIATYDSDFEEACNELGIVVLKSVEDVIK